MKMKAKAKGIDLLFECHASLGSHFIGDPTRLKQIVMNLVSNAIKFTDNGSVTLKAEPDSDTVKINVADTGIGIPSDKQESIFSKFSQADSSITRKYGGTGLGLAITRNLVRLMNGRITVVSEPGVGSTFTVRIPLLRTRAGIPKSAKTLYPPVHKDKTATAGHTPNILLVEDNEANLLVASSILNDLGYHCEIAHTGKEALEKMKQHSFDLALMDVQMPVLDGYKTTRIIRETEARQHKRKLPIIGITAHVLSGNREKCLQAGMNDYIAKPFHLDELQSKLQQYIATQAA
jgi:CheY-like chemotaxis protein